MGQIIIQLNNLYYFHTASYVNNSHLAAKLSDYNAEVLALKMRTKNISKTRFQENIDTNFLIIRFVY